MERGGILKPIWLPVVVAVIVVPTVVAAVVGGPGLAIIVAVVLLVAIVFVAVRSRPKEPIEVAEAPTRPHFLDRWASDVGKSEAEARRKLDVTVADRLTVHFEHVVATETGNGRR
jgi:hypothetical protein